MQTPSQSKKQSVKRKHQSDSLNSFLKPIIERIVEERMSVYKVALKDSLMDYFKDSKSITLKDIEEFFDNEI